jgi:hypothetical protein
VLVLPGEDTDRMFVVKGIGQADGTLLGNALGGDPEAAGRKDLCGRRARGMKN